METAQNSRVPPQSPREDGDPDEFDVRSGDAWPAATRHERLANFQRREAIIEAAAAGSRAGAGVVPVVRWPDREARQMLREKQIEQEERTQALGTKQQQHQPMGRRVARRLVSRRPSAAEAASSSTARDSSVADDDGGPRGHSSTCGGGGAAAPTGRSDTSSEADIVDRLRGVRLVEGLRSVRDEIKRNDTTLEFLLRLDECITEPFAREMATRGEGAARALIAETLLEHTKGRVGSPEELRLLIEDRRGRCREYLRRTEEQLCQCLEIEETHRRMLGTHLTPIDVDENVALGLALPIGIVVEMHHVAEHLRHMSSAVAEVRPLRTGQWVQCGGRCGSPSRSSFSLIGCQGLSIFHSSGRARASLHPP